jgi:uncharacterized protein YdhG (YjbR/CyaY superfamily)
MIWYLLYFNLNGTAVRETADFSSYNNLREGSDFQENTMSKKKESQKSDGFTAEEKAAMKARAKELKAEARANKKREEGEKVALEAIAEMEAPDRAMAERIHALITENAPDLWPKTWYGMPAYALDGKVVCFFQSAQKFGARYATLGFNDTATLDEGNMWPTAFALKAMTAAEEEAITAVVKKAVGLL